MIKASIDIKRISKNQMIASPVFALIASLCLANYFFVQEVAAVAQTETVADFQGNFLQLKPTDEAAGGDAAGATDVNNSLIFLESTRGGQESK